MPFGPLGPSLAPYVRSSRTLSKWLKPIANWYANLAGYRRMGLLYDDLRTSPTPHQTPPTYHGLVLRWREKH
jgi:ubiquinol-cytochrome c reductase subunit 7